MRLEAAEDPSAPTHAWCRREPWAIRPSRSRGAPVVDISAAVIDPSVLVPWKSPQRIAIELRIDSRAAAFSFFEAASPTKSSKS